MRSISNIALLTLTFVLMVSVATATKGSGTPPTPSQQFDDLMTAIYVLFGMVLIGMPLYSVRLGNGPPRDES